MSSNPIDDAIIICLADVEYNLRNEDDVIDWLKNIASTNNRVISSLEYVFCSDAFLLEINKKYLSHDTLTDIITFPLNDNPLEATIYISIERVDENAKTYSISPEEELHRVMAHGLLHLVGFKDKSDEEKSEMRNQENAVLDQRTFI